MMQKTHNILITLFCLFLLLPCFADAKAYLEITSVHENIFSGKGVYVEGVATPGDFVSSGIYDADDNLIYTLKTTVDAQGKWFVSFDQPLKNGSYYIQSKIQDSGGASLVSVKSAPISVRGPFAFIIAIFSILVIFLTTVFLVIWYLSKRAEVRRCRRILISERDIASAYEVMKNDAQTALAKISSGKSDGTTIRETEFLLERINENLEKMNKYITKGINILSKYDIIGKIDKVKKAKK